jgi:alcohol dehydrogenase class IV
MNLEIFNFYLPTRVLSGPNSVHLSGEEVGKLGCKNVLIVTDMGIQDAGIVDRATNSLDSAEIKYKIFNDVLPDPPTSTIDAALKAYREGKCDGILAVGGGSSIDTAKGAGVVATNPGSIKDYEGAMKVKNPIPSLVCIPTTHGTSSEIGYAAMLTDEERKFKYYVASPFMAPKVAILDPTLMVNLPAQVAAASGMDALTHAIESYCSTLAQPFSEGLALHAIRLISENLRKAVTTDDLEATYNMAIASTMAGMAATHTRQGTIHAMAHALGGEFHTTHGIACAFLMPYVMEFNLISCPEKFAVIAQAMGEAVEGLDTLRAAQKAIGAVKKLCVDVGIPLRLAELAIPKDAIPTLAKNTMMGNVATNPRRTTYGDVVKIFEATL